MWIIQLALLIVLVPIQYGPFGHYLALIHGSPDLFAVSVWSFSWLTNEKVSLEWAVLLGITMDLLSFWPFGTWTIIWLVLTLLINYSKRRFFDVASIVEAVVALALSSLLVLVIEMTILGQWSLEGMVVGVITNCLFGGLVYYVLAMRYQLMDRWKGKQL